MFEGTEQEIKRKEKMNDLQDWLDICNDKVGVNLQEKEPSDSRRRSVGGREREGAGGGAPEDEETGAKIPEEAENLPNIEDKRLIGWCREAKLASLSCNKCSVAALLAFQEKCSLRCVFLEFSC